MKTVRVNWKWIEWKKNHKWRDDIAPQLDESSLKEQDLTKCVYVVSAFGNFAIEYPKGVSPTLYIGSGNFKNRLLQHEKWLSEITDLIQDYSFSIAVCIPKVKGQSVHKDMEAALIHKFKEMYGCIPLRNHRIENPSEDYRYLPEKDFKYPLMIGKGYRFHWAIRPLKSNRYYESYCAKF